MKAIKKLLPILLILLLAGGYAIYSGALPVGTSNIPSGQSFNAAKTVDATTSVLGATTKSVASKIKDFYEGVADDKEEALINSMVETISKQLVGIPESQAKKIKYQFCQEFIEEGNTELPE